MWTARVEYFNPRAREGRDRKIATFCAVKLNVCVNYSIKKNKKTFLECANLALDYEHHRFLHEQEILIRVIGIVLPHRRDSPVALFS